MAAPRQVPSHTVPRKPSCSTNSSFTRTPVSTVSLGSRELPVSPWQVAEPSSKNLWEQICDGSPKEYLETFIFPVLLPGMASLLHQAKKEKCFERKRTKFIACDFLTEWLYNQNPKRAGEPFTEFFSIPFVEEWLKQHPRPPIPLSLLLTEEEAALYIQSFWRAYLLPVPPFQRGASPAAAVPGRGVGVHFLPLCALISPVSGFPLGTASQPGEPMSFKVALPFSGRGWLSCFLADFRYGPGEERWCLAQRQWPTAWCLSHIFLVNSMLPRTPVQDNYFLILCNLGSDLKAI
ncbi:IQ domain-containing protein K isoform X2 [Chlorocebus sabaeus]|uniref:IQ domain-containing protein K isoform X2 n=1 Tax=Chlorocebus sabaeus TaxID=60711 RepID=UPI003BFA0732